MKGHLLWLRAVLHCEWKFYAERLQYLKIIVLQHEGRYPMYFDWNQSSVFIRFHSVVTSSPSWISMNLTGQIDLFEIDQNLVSNGLKCSEHTQFAPFINYCTCSVEVGIKLQLFDGELTISSTKCSNYFNEWSRSIRYLIIILHVVHLLNRDSLS